MRGSDGFSRFDKTDKQSIYINKYKDRHKTQSLVQKLFRSKIYPELQKFS